jgi:signal transduction histidine kinase/ligand-binding sensor domain-containing protein
MRFSFLAFYPFSLYFLHRTHALHMKLVVRIAFSLIFILEIQPPVLSQVLPFRNYTSRDGLLSNYSLALCNDSRGYLWIGSNDGLTRYDGIFFRNFTVADGLAFSRVTCLRESKDEPGILWIGTNGGGISRFADGHFTNYRVGSTLWSNSINAITEDYTGRIWAATSEGVFFLDDSTFVHLRYDAPRTEQTTVLASPDSSVWIVTDRRIFSYSPETETTHVIPISPPRSSVFQACAVDSTGTVWLTTSGGTILNVKKETVVGEFSSGAHLHSFLTFGTSGTAWIGVENGILRINRSNGLKRKFTRYTTQNGLRDDAVLDGVIDREGDLWLAYSASGIAKLSDYSVVTYPLNTQAYPPNNTTALSDQHDHLWVGSGGSLWEFWNDEAEGWRSYRHGELRSGMNGSAPVSLCLDKEQALWVSLANGSILRYRVRSLPKGPSHLSLVNGFHPGTDFPKASPMFLYCDRDGYVWGSMGDNRGVFLFDPGKRSPLVRTFSTSDGLPDMSVRAIFQDTMGNLWFGGYAGGLSVLSAGNMLTGHLHLFAEDRGLPNSAIRSIIQDSSGVLWIGTRYGGLAYFKDSLFHQVSLNEGLMSTAVWCMAHGSGNRLWVGTQLGIQSLEPSSRDFSTKKAWDGNPVYACGQTSTGDLWYVSTDGLTIYDSANDRDNSVSPPIAVTHFEVNGIAFPTTGAFELSSDQDNCSIEVAGISLRDEESLRYQYRLLGANNEEWRPPTRNRAIVFASLAPGSYTFMARAVNASGVTSDHPAELQFTILPPFWRQWWFIGGIGVFFVLVAALLIRIRLMRLLAIERLRAGIATDLHDDIGSGLTRIAVLSDVAFQQVQAASEAGTGGGETTEVLNGLEKVRTTARTLMETMADVVWAIDPSHDSFERLVQRLRSFAYELCEGKGIKLTFDVPDEVLSVKLTSEGMRNVLLLSKEALTNIAKHSHATAAVLCMKIADRRLVVTVSDDGKGFDPGAVDAGNGLVNMRKRAQISGASFDLESKAGGGTRIVATFSLAG